MKKEKTPKIMNLDEKIYLLCYGKSRYTTEIAELIYGKEERQRYPTITGKNGIIAEMVKNNELTEIPIESGEMEAMFIPIKPKIDTTDGRSKTLRKYYLSKTTPIFNSIVSIFKEKKITLTKEENENILFVLNSPEYRELIENNLPKKEVNGEIQPDISLDINPGWFIISSFCNTAGVVYGIKHHLKNRGISESMILKRWDSVSDTKLRKYGQKQRIIQTALEILNKSMGNVIGSKKAAKLFLEMKLPLLHKLSQVTTEGPVNAALILAGSILGNHH
ncbi:MAG: hypothetical protein JSW06_06795 [Thermoplasmatales archaeon]|nr:MAG: hypothetical protein JSW06_06795 [Thermoplasmatales archaeon]